MERFVFAVIQLLFALIFLLVAVVLKHRDRGFRTGESEVTVGVLSHMEYKKNVKIQRWEDRGHNWIRGTYTYIVDGTKFAAQCIVIDRSGALPSSTKVIYQSKRPRIAYLPEFQKAPREGDYSILYFFAAMFVGIGVMLLLS